MVHLPQTASHAVVARMIAEAKGRASSPSRSSFLIRPIRASAKKGAMGTYWADRGRRAAGRRAAGCAGWAGESLLGPSPGLLGAFPPPPGCLLGVNFFFVIAQEAVFRGTSRRRENGCLAFWVLRLEKGKPKHPFLLEVVAPGASQSVELTAKIFS